MKVLGELRARFTLNRVLVAIVLVAVFLGIVSLVQGGSSSHTDHAVALVPPDALLYAHLTVDRDSRQWRYARRIVNESPALQTLLDRSLGAFGTGRTAKELDAALQPWLGDEAALALLPNGQRATSLILLKVRNPKRAKSFLAGAGRSRIELYRNAQVRIYDKLAASLVDDFLVIGRLRNVHRALDARAGVSLSEVGLFRQARGGIDSGGSLLYAYVPNEGVRRLLQQQKGLVGRVGDLLARPALRATAAAARFERRGIRVSVSDLEFERLPGAALAAPTFAPQLPRSVPQDAIAYYGVQGVTQLLRKLETLSGGRASDLTRGIARLRRQLHPSGVRALARALKPLDRREAALVVTPPDDAPVVSLIVGDTTQKEGGDMLFALQPLLSRIVNATQGGAAATLIPGSEAGVDTLTLRLNPELSLTYAALGDRIMISTDPAGVRQVATAEKTLLGDAAFAPGMRELLKGATSLLFLDLHRLSSLIERAGFGRTPEYRAIKPELGKIGAVSVITQSERSSQTTQAFIEVP
jgi:Protein of unknown function (DUF3352)